MTKNFLVTLSHQTYIDTEKKS